MKEFVIESLKFAGGVAGAVFLLWWFIYGAGPCKSTGVAFQSDFLISGPPYGFYYRTCIR